jgi:hypothetical protein
MKINNVIRKQLLNVSMLLCFKMKQFVEAINYFNLRILNQLSWAKNKNIIISYYYLENDVLHVIYFI